MNDETEVTASQAKKIVAAALLQHGLGFTKLVARKVSFSDLARCSRYFVKAEGLKLPNPKIADVKETLKETKVYLDLT